MYRCVFFSHLHVFLRRPWVPSRALGCGACTGPVCTQRCKCGSRAGSVALALGVQSREIWQVITGWLSVELLVEPSKTMENPYVRCFATLLQKFSTWWQPRYKSSRASSLCGLLLRVCGHWKCVFVVCYDTCACVWVRTGPTNIGDRRLSPCYLIPLVQPLQNYLELVYMTY